MKEIVLQAETKGIPVVTDWINRELETLNCPQKTIWLIDVAVDEILGNIAQYAYDDQAGFVTVRIEFDPGGRVISITFLDNAFPYNPLERKDPDISLSLEQREIGGLGVFLTKKIMDEINYQYINGQNVLRIQKKI